MEWARYKPTGLVFKVKRVRKSGKVELENKTVVPSEEFRLNWTVEK